MTVLFDDITNIAGASETRPLRFFVPVLRENDSGDGIVTTARYEAHVEDGEFTTPDMDAGPAKVRIGLDTFDIIIPESASPVRLWPLIDAGMPQPPADTPGFVRNGGRVDRIQAVTMAEYADMTHDPETLYVIEDSDVGE